MSETPAKPDRTLPIILIVIAALAIVAVVVVFGRGEPEPLDPSTPEGTVQRYATAVIDGDEAAALSLLSPQWLADCDPMSYGHPSSDLRLTLISSSERGSTTTVKVSIASSSGSGPFDSSTYEYEDSFQLQKDGDSWLVRSAPWEFATCPVGGSR